ncbi:hypothetical protein Acy02nite_85690 [Actinoplanes cyaneus]|uniref:Uncharacterized protein n=1 Tax=Actinoplanes cyaneus TaxID=52696 RepID=A0A919MAM5_9ACTN|nr:hypothetical protein [Actinoplanes cyaneus]MCW2143908.1 hypothetical protein [Actinoplanes cyaneus]GID70688.1 hypothetical protein Acy02nite_85690 [Actinoplanes cyaneus]
MTDVAGELGPLPRRLVAWAEVIAPVSLVSAVLFYFGYVSAHAQYEYFGVDVDVVGLGTQDYVMRSPQPLLVPLLTLALAGAGGLLLHLVLRRRIAVASRANRERRVRRLLRVAESAGAVVLAAAVALLFAYPRIGLGEFFGLLVPVLLICGAGLIWYTWRLADLLPPAAEPAGRDPGEPAAADPAPRLRRGARFLLAVVLVAATFWATATVAQWSGRGLARDVAARPDHLPRVILDTKERLYLRSTIVEETRLPVAEGQDFHYRYRRLRLLVTGKDRMFLIPEVWSASNTTLVVPIDDTVRVQFQVENDAPN